MYSLKNIFFFHSWERCTILCLAETGDNLNKIKPQLLSQDRVWPKFFFELRLGYNRDPKFIVNRLPIRLFTTFEKIIGEWMCRISKFWCFNQEKCSWHEMFQIKDVSKSSGYLVLWLISLTIPSLFKFYQPRYLNWRYLNKNECTVYTAICKINYFISLKPQYIRRREIRTSFLLYIARMPQTLSFSSMKLLLHLWKCLEQITVEKKTSSIHLLYLFIG